MALTEDQPPFASLRVLLVEDNVRLQQMMARSLESLGCVVTRVNDAAQAIETLGRHNRFDLMLSDIRMPGELDGIGLAEWVSVQHPHVAVILLTGFAQHRNHRFSVLQKPFGMEHLVEAMRLGLVGKELPNSAVAQP